MATTSIEESRPVGEVREIVRLGLPMLVGVLSSTFDGVIDTAMMGRYGADSLAAVAGASAVLDVFTTVALATVVGHQILSARFAGREDGAGVRGSLLATAKLATAVTLPLVTICVLFGETLTGMVTLHANGAVPAIGAEFLVAVAPTLVFAVIFATLAATFNAYKLTRAPMVAGLIILGSNVALDWLLIFGRGPFPQLGAVGNGLATTLSWVIGLIFMLVIAHRQGLRRKLETSHDGPIDFETSVVKLSWPAMVSMAMDYASTAVFFGIVGGLGAAALSGGRIAFHVMVLIYGLGTAFLAAVRILIGRSAGAGNLGSARAIMRAGRLVLLPPAFTIGITLILGRDVVAAVFTAFPEIRLETRNALLLVGVVVPLIAWNLSNVSVIRAFGRTKLDMYGNLMAAVVIQLPIAWVLGELLGLGVAGAFIGVGSYWIARGAFLEICARMCIRTAEETKGR